MTFNFPKDLIYKDAYRLSVFFDEGISYFLDYLKD
jgi:hypothetical protein